MQLSTVPLPRGACGFWSVSGSWMNERAIVYRKLNNIPAHWGTAVNVQAMVFGNMGTTSATGVAFTRNPSDGERSFFGEFLVNAQGEDVVAGTRTPQQITRAASRTWAKENDVAEGDRVIYRNYAGTTIEWLGIEYLLIKEEDLQAKVTN